jgi:pseudouridine synthase
MVKRKAAVPKRARKQSSPTRQPENRRKRGAATAKRRTPQKRAPPVPGVQRLQKILSGAGVASRRKAEELIQAGQVRVNDRVVTELGAKADIRVDRITVSGRPLHLGVPRVYLILHKPVGVVTTLSDPEGRPTVRDLLTKVRTRVYPVGRLDYHSSGLLLLTNDGELAQRLMHPRYEVPKTYWVKVKGVPTAETLAKLSGGVRLEDGRTGPASVRRMRSQGEKAWLEITISEGRRREVRRMCDKVGHPVEKLSRVRLGPVQLGKLLPGRSRDLSAREIAELRRAVGL